MRSYRLTQAAQDDIDQIWDYIAANDPRAADRFIGNFHDCFELLGTYKLIGQDRSDLTVGL